MVSFFFISHVPHPRNIQHFPGIIGFALLTVYLPSWPWMIHIDQHHRRHVSASTTWKNCNSFRPQLYLPHLRTSRGDSRAHSSGQEIATAGSIRHRKARGSPSPSFEDHGCPSQRPRKLTFEACTSRRIHNERHDQRRRDRSRL